MFCSCWTGASFIGARAAAETHFAADGSPTTRGGRFYGIPIVGDTRKEGAGTEGGAANRSINLERVDTLGYIGIVKKENGEDNLYLMGGLWFGSSTTMS